LPKRAVNVGASDLSVESAVGEKEAQELVQVGPLLDAKGLSQRRAAESLAQRPRHAPPGSQQSGRDSQRALRCGLAHLTHMHKCTDMRDMREMRDREIERDI